MSHTSLRWHLLVILALSLLVPTWARAQLATDNPYGTPAAPPATRDAGEDGANTLVDAPDEASAEPSDDANASDAAAPESPDSPIVPAPETHAVAPEPAAEAHAEPSAVQGESHDEFAEADAESGVVEAPAETPIALSLVPPGEAERVGDHAVDLPHIRFRPGHGLELASADGQFAIATRVRVQMLYQLEVPNAAGSDPQQQLTLRRARLQLGGHFFGADNRFKLELALSPRDEGIRDNDSGRSPQHTPLLDFYLEFRQLRDLRVRIGQFKVPFNRERVNSSGNLQMVGRSIVNGEFNLDRDVGIDLSSQDLFGLGYLRYHVGVYIARGREAVGFGGFRMMSLARVEFLPFGSFNDMSQVDFERTSAPRLAIGAAAGYVDQARNDRGITGSPPADGGTTQTRHLAFDAIFKLSGFSAMGELLYRSGRRNPGTAVDDMGVPIPIEAPSDGYGVTLQAGYLLPRVPFEIAARYATIRRIGSATESSLDRRSELGLGVSWYFARHPFKLQADVMNRWNRSFGNDGEMLFELQLQGSL
ncbi:MAG: hypothetical protein GXP55_23240 [Deltaproteobacteria bacterium]|nr:hypothetical protein [Deltaproteobacteria bacterium]